VTSQPKEKFILFRKPTLPNPRPREKRHIMINGIGIFEEPLVPTYS